MFAIYLLAPGPNRLKAIMTVRRIRGISYADAKSLVEAPRSVIATGNARYIATLRNELKGVGAAIEIAYYPQGMEPERWVNNDNSLDKKACRHCGLPLFFAIPGQTTPEEIMDFGNKATIPNMEEIARTRWIHPGVYCPRGCFFVMVDFDHPDHYL